MKYSLNEIIDGSLSLSQEQEYWGEIGRLYFLLALSKNRVDSIQHLESVKENPNRATFKSFINYLLTLLDTVEYQDWPDKDSFSEKLFLSGKFSARVGLNESLAISDENIPSIFTKRFAGLLEDITLPLMSTEFSPNFRTKTKPKPD